MQIKLVVVVVVVVVVLLPALGLLSDIKDACSIRSSMLSNIGSLQLSCLLSPL